MAKGARRLKSKLKGVLQPFQPILVSWTGKGEVPTLTSAEIDQSEFNLLHHDLRGDSLVCGFYCNELLISLLHRYDPHIQLFQKYHETILALNDTVADRALADSMRGFEQAIMRETGYELSFLTEADGKTMISDNQYYVFQAAEGFVRLAGDQANAVQGRVIKSLHGAELAKTEPEIAAQAKLLMREILAKTLGNKKITSRELFFPKQRVE